MQREALLTKPAVPITQLMNAVENIRLSYRLSLVPIRWFRNIALRGKNTQKIIIFTIPLIKEMKLEKLDLKI